MTQKEELKELLKYDIAKSSDYQIDTKTNSLELSLPEYLTYLSGRDSARGNQARSTVQLTLLKVSKDTNFDVELQENSFKEVSSRNTNRADVCAKLMPNDFVCVELNFLSAFEPELQIVLNELKKYSSLLDSAINGTGDIPFLVLNACPIDFLGESLISFSNPVFWSLASEELGVSPKSIKLLFPLESVGILDMANCGVSAIDEIAFAKRS